MRIFIIILLVGWSGAARAADITITIPDDKAKTWVLLPMIIEKCTSDIAFRGDMNACLYLRNFVQEFSTKMKNELDAQAAQEKK